MRIRHSLEGKIALLLGVALAVAMTSAALVTRATASAWYGVLFAAALVLPALLYALHKLMHPVNRLFQALTDGVSGLKDNDFSVSIARERTDELGTLVDVYNSLGEVLRRERQNILQRELLLDTVIQTTPMALVLTDEKDTILMANTAARSLFGAGHRLEGHGFAAQRATLNPAFNQAVERGADGLFTVESGDDSDTWHLSVRRFSLNGQIRWLFLFKRMTRELSRQEVATWKNVIRVIAHELNNSLAPISSLANSGRLVAAQPDQDKLDTIFTTIGERATHLKSFIDGYAKFAKLPQPRPAPVDWCGFLEALQQAIPFRVDLPLPSEAGWFDQTQIEQVLINLLKNAHESGSPATEITLGVQRFRDGARLRVTDRGSGMSEAVLASAMLPFYSTKRSGTGLGMTLAREIVEAHGGRMSIANRDKGGLVVDLWLPGQPVTLAPGTGWTANSGV